MANFELADFVGMILVGILLIGMIWSFLETYIFRWRHRSGGD